MKIVILIIELYIRVIVLIFQGLIAAASAIGTLISRGIQCAIASRQKPAPRTITNVTISPTASRSNAIPDGVSYAYCDESERYFELADALSTKAKNESDSVKRAKLMQQAATAYRKAEQFAAKTPDYPTSIR